MNAKELEELRREVLQAGSVLIIDQPNWGHYAALYAKVVSAEPEPDGGFVLTVDPGADKVRYHFTDRDYDTMWFLSARKAAVWALGQRKIWVENRIREFKRGHDGIAAEIKELEEMSDEDFAKRHA